MKSFPTFMKSEANRIAEGSQHTPGVEGFLFDGADGSQVAFWQCPTEAATLEHVHSFDEYFVVIEGSCLLTLDGREVRVDAGEECLIPRGTRIAGRVAAGTRTIHVFGGRRAVRAVSDE